MDREALTRQLGSLQKRRAALFYPAIALSLIGVFRRSPILGVAAALFWLGAGALCMMEASVLSKLKLKPGPTLVNAVIYLGIGLLSLFRR
jgi:hypothetical protein